MTEASATKKQCPGCPVKFVPRRKDQRFHDAKCRIAHWMRTHPRTAISE